MESTPAKGKHSTLIFIGKVALGALIALAIHQKFIAPMLAPKLKA